MPIISKKLHAFSLSWVVYTIIHNNFANNCGFDGSWLNILTQHMHIWAAAWQNQQNGMCAQWRLISAWASAQSDQGLRCPHEESLGP